VPDNGSVDVLTMDFMQRGVSNEFDIALKSLSIIFHSGSLHTASTIVPIQLHRKPFESAGSVSCASRDCCDVPNMTH